MLGGGVLKFQPAAWLHYAIINLALSAHHHRRDSNGNQRKSYQKHAIAFHH